MAMKRSARLAIRKGFGFGITSGIITTLGMIVGLHSSTHSTSVIIRGILIIAIADALSDALGIHMSEEAELRHTAKDIWKSTFVTFLSKLFFALTFIVPVLLFGLSTAIAVSIAWGLFLITIFSLYLAKKEKLSPYHVVFEHLIIAIIVVIITHYFGDWIRTRFG